MITIPVALILLLVQIFFRYPNPLLHAAEAYWAMGSLYMLAVIIVMLKDIIIKRYRVSSRKAVAMFLTMLVGGPIAVLYLGGEEKEEKSEVKEA